MGGDGNCLFRAVSVLLYGTENEHVLIWESVMDYVEECKDYFQAFITVPIENYIRFKRKLGTWGDEVEI